MSNEPVISISDSDLAEVMKLVARQRAIPAVIVAAIVERLEAAERVVVPSFEQRRTFAFHS